MATAYRMATEFARDVWLDGLGQLIDNRTGVPINTGSGVLSDFIDSVYRHDPRLASPDRNPYGAHRYPRLGMGRINRTPDRDWWDDDE